MTALSLDTRLTADATVLSREIEGETILLSMSRTEYFGLNATGTRVWQLLQEPRSVREICELMAAEFDTSPPVLEHDVLAVARELVVNDLVRVVS